MDISHTISEKKFYVSIISDHEVGYSVNVGMAFAVAKSVLL